MVMPASRMLSAISLGVFCRSAPSTRAIMRSRKEEPCAAVIRTTIQSERTVVPPVTADRSPPASRITGADSPVIAASFTEAMPSITSPSPGIMSPASTSTMSPGRSCEASTPSQISLLSPGMRMRLARVSSLAPPQRFGLRPPAALGDRLGEVGEQHGEPEPGGDLAAEQRRLACHQVAHEEDRHERRYDRRHEDHGVLDQRVRIELAHRVEGGAPDQRRIGDGRLIAFAQRTRAAVAVAKV